jgi:hypothetical protein
MDAGQGGLFRGPARRSPLARERGYFAGEAPVILAALPRMRYILPLLAALLAPIWCAAQVEARVSGTVRDDAGTTLPGASVAVVGTAFGSACDAAGRYELVLPPGTYELRFSFSGTQPRTVEVALAPGESRTLDAVLKGRTLDPVMIEGVRREREVGMTPIDPRLQQLNPSPLQGMEKLLAGQIGLVTRNELSSGYSVRGGNFDENIVFVNDIEVYRPFLVRAGQQEGLSFPNPDMIERIRFSAGGFEPRYGDKLSSVLDIQYKRPERFGGTAMASLLGGSFHIEDAPLHKRLRHITGFRYRTNQLLLRGLDTQGDYRPVYTDLQTYWTYDVSPNVEIGFLGNYGRNQYNLIPSDRQTEFGTFNQALRFTVFFDGRERTEFETFFGALSTNVKASRDLLLKFTASAFRTFENERFTILARYRLDELERDLGSDQFGEAVANLGIGTYLDHARNQLDATVFAFAHRAFLQRSRGTLQWGADLRGETINDRLNEWTLIDSADFSIPLNSGDVLEVNKVLKTRLALESVRAAAYVQNTWRWDGPGDRWWTLNAGMRGQFWSWNGQALLMPRARLTWHPGWKTIKAEGDTVDNDYSFWLAAGLYHQPPFYREVRRLDGTLNPDIRAQRSTHLLLGFDRRFTLWDRPFSFTTEAYYKDMRDVIPYQVDNVRIRYLGTNNAKAYATGIDARLAGQFIDGVESWFSVGILSTREDLRDDFYVRRFNAAGQEIFPGFTFDQVAVDSVVVQPGWIRRPTDQRVNVAMFFQDEMTRWPTFKVHLSLVFGTNLPFGPPDAQRFADTLRTAMYRRVDIGFSKQLLGAAGQEKSGFLGHIRNLWISAEVFNLLNINNTIDHTWVTDVNGRYYSIPDFLTPRRFNLKLVAWF